MVRSVWLVVHLAFPAVFIAQEEKGGAVVICSCVSCRDENNASPYSPSSPPMPMPYVFQALPPRQKKRMAVPRPPPPSPQCHISSDARLPLLDPRAAPLEWRAAAVSALLRSLFDQLRREATHQYHEHSGYAQGKRQHSHPDPAVVSGGGKHARVGRVPSNRITAGVVRLDLLHQDPRQLVPDENVAV